MRRRRKKRLFVGIICLVIALIIGVIYIIEEKPYASIDVLANEVSERTFIYGKTGDCIGDSRNIHDCWTYYGFSHESIRGNCGV